MRIVKNGSNLIRRGGISNALVGRFPLNLETLQLRQLKEKRESMVQR